MPLTKLHCFQVTRCSILIKIAQGIAHANRCYSGLLLYKEICCTPLKKKLSASLPPSPVNSKIMTPNCKVYCECVFPSSTGRRTRSLRHQLSRRSKFIYFICLKRLRLDRCTKLRPTFKARPTLIRQNPLIHHEPFAALER